MATWPGGVGWGAERLPELLKHSTGTTGRCAAGCPNTNYISEMLPTLLAVSGPWLFPRYHGLALLLRRCIALCRRRCLPGHNNEGSPQSSGFHVGFQLRLRAKNKINAGSFDNRKRSCSGPTLLCTQLTRTRTRAVLLQTHDAFTGHSLGAAASAVMMGMMGMRYLKTKKVSASSVSISVRGGRAAACTGLRTQGGGDSTGAAPAGGPLQGAVPP